MKKLSLVISMLISFVSTTIAQELSNTLWEVYEEGYFLAYTGFTDTHLEFSIDGDDYYEVSEYTIVDDVFSIVDVSLEFDCEDAIGTYNYQIEDDVLTFTVILDPCIDRKVIMANTMWIGAESTGILEREKLNRISVYPNPAVDILTVELQSLSASRIYNVYDMYGRLVLSGILDKPQKSIDVTSISSGVYTLQIEGEGSSRFIRK